MSRMKDNLGYEDISELRTEENVARVRFFEANETRKFQDVEEMYEIRSYESRIKRKKMRIVGESERISL